MAQSFHADSSETAYRFYNRHTFYRLILLFIGITIIVDFAIYIAQTKNLMNETQEDLRNIAVVVAKNIPVEQHERLRQSSQQDSTDYKTIEFYFKSVIDGNPKIDDVYTLRPTSKNHVMTFVVSGMTTHDKNGDGTIDESEQKPVLGEAYNTADYPDLEKGLTEPSVDKEVTYDKWGTWLSGYAPIRNTAGNSVGLVGVDMSAQYLSEQRMSMLMSIVWSNCAILPLLLVAGYFMSRRISRPFSLLADGMEKVSHGNYDYQLPIKGKGDANVFAHLFNNIVNMCNDIKRVDPSAPKNKMSK
ncbi:MAG: HAMP domain-containing protein [Patescibacteria group bacterium]